jgi:hypothetical protein
MTATNKPIAGESTKEAVKTIACGNAGLLRWTCGADARVLYLISHARLRVHWAPGIPHALVFLGGSFLQNPDASRRGIAEVHLLRCF